MEDLEGADLARMDDSDPDGIQPGDDIGHIARRNGDRSGVERHGRRDLTEVFNPKEGCRRIEGCRQICHRLQIDKSQTPESHENRGGEVGGPAEHAARGGPAGRDGAEGAPRWRRGIAVHGSARRRSGLRQGSQGAAEEHQRRGRVDSRHRPHARHIGQRGPTLGAYVAIPARL
jgi:hypothetical protein